MTLREWLRKFHTRPQMIVAVFLLGVWSIFAVRSYLVIEKKHLTYVKQTSDLLSIASMQSNRIMAESVMEILVSQGGAISAEVCDGDKQIIGTNLNLQSCLAGPAFLEKIIEEKVVGSAKQVLRARFNIANDLLSLLNGLGISLFLVFSGFYFIQSTKDKIKRDIFEPLLKKLLGTEKLEIKELTELRQEIVKAQELEAQKAVTLAIQENNQQVAHDMRSPIQSIQAIVAMMKLPESELKLALDKAIDRAGSVSNFLLKSEIKIQNSSKKLIYDVAKIVNDIAVEKRPIFTDGSISVNTEQNIFIETKLPKELLARTLSNIVDNAMLASYSNKKIEIFVSKNSDCVEIKIKDYGRGINPEVLHRIGEKGFSFRESKENNGTGRGVYAAKLILDEIGGDFKIDSTVGKGTEVTISFPTLPPSILEKNPDFILIDDEDLHKIVWQSWSAENNKAILAVSCVAEFFLYSDQIKKNTPVFLDSDLGDGKKGEDFACQIYKMGFQEIYLATAYDHFKNTKVPFVSGVFGKDPRKIRLLLNKSVFTEKIQDQATLQ